MNVDDEMGDFHTTKLLVVKLQESVTLPLADFLRSGRNACFSNKSVRTAVLIQIKHV